MSLSYYFVNHTRKEWFPVDALGGSRSWRALGISYASRAFESMLMRPSGRWAGQVIAISYDTDEEMGYEQLTASYANISANAIVTVFKADGMEHLAEVARGDDQLYLHLCYLVTSRQCLELDGPMKAAFGNHYLAGFKGKLEKWQRPWRQLTDIVT